MSAKELVLANDENFQNWTDFAEFDVNDPTDLASIDFTAQTTIAASYGLMQIMYMTAIESGWKTNDGRQNPSLLFDNPNTWNSGGGSLAAGTLHFYTSYRDDNVRPGNWATDPNFATPVDYQSMIIAALNFYNHGTAHTNLLYGDQAWAYSLQYSPAHPLNIFP